MNRRLAIIVSASVVVWALAGVSVLDRLMLLRSQTTLVWSRPTKPNANFAWSSPPPVIDGRVRLLPGEQRSAQITVPRAFSTGQFSVAVLMDSGGALELRAPTRVGRPIAVTTIREAFGGQLDVRWDDVAASTRTFALQLHNVGSQPVSLQHVSLTLRR